MDRSTSVAGGRDEGLRPADGSPLLGIKDHTGNARAMGESHRKATRGHEGGQPACCKQEESIHVVASELGDAGGPARWPWQLTWPARSVILFGILTPMHYGALMMES